MMNDLKHLGLPRRRARPDWILGIAAGVAFLGLLSWISNHDAEYQRELAVQQTHIEQLAGACPEPHLQEGTP